VRPGFDDVTPTGAIFTSVSLESSHAVTSLAGASAVSSSFMVALPLDWVWNSSVPLRLALQR